MKKITLTSIVAITFALPAFAESFPGNGYMLENKTYDGAATYTNMGVYSDSVNATADYSDNTYTVTAGTYLPAASETVTQCPANSFCPGLTGPTYYDANNAQGATACSTLTGGYNSSDAGSSANTDCYKACTTSDVAHSTAVTGNDYYGAGVDTCAATGCENGYHTYTNTPDLNTILGTAPEFVYIDNSGVSYDYIRTNGSSYSYNGSGDPSIYGLSENNSFAVDYGNGGVITGHGLCSTQSGTGVYNSGVSTADQVTKIDNLTPEFGTGQYCYCQLDSYTPVSGTSQSLSGPWVFDYNLSSASSCMNECAHDCAGILSYKSTAGTNRAIFRDAIFGSTVSTEPATCEANTITINWSDVDGVNGTHTTDVSYDGDITTPVKAATKPGKTFVGWKFVKPGS